MNSSNSPGPAVRRAQTLCDRARDHYFAAQRAITRVEMAEALTRAQAALSEAGRLLREAADDVADLRRQVEAGGLDDLPALE